MSKDEITNTIYDTIMQNIGMSEHHVPFPAELVIDQECNAKRGTIRLQVKDGSTWEIKVNEICCMEGN